MSQKNEKSNDSAIKNEQAEATSPKKPNDADKSASQAASKPQPAEPLKTKQEPSDSPNDKPSHSIPDKAASDPPVKAEGQGNEDAQSKVKKAEAEEVKS